VAAGLTVGDFSRITHLSVKTLRHYHEVGLLEPATVNPGTGYRYYSTAQVPTAQVIRRLRDLEMPVSQVKAVLDAPDAPARNALIAAHLGQLEAELAETRAAVESLRHLLQPPGSLSDADLSYATLGSYATRHEISIDGPLREYYLRGVADTPDEAEWRTEIGWPIFRADASSGSARPAGTGG
jgi:DNA-binding transcriptional MerR regulator